MSAFQVSDAHIDALVHARWFERGHSGPIEVQGVKTHEVLTDRGIGQMLIRENMLSLSARYTDEKVCEEAVEAYRCRPPIRAFTAVELIKAIHCYVYQASEHDGWKGSAASSYCDRLEQALTRALPGYDAAPWGIES